MFPDFEEDLAAALDQSLAEVSSAPAQPTQMSSPTWVSRPKPIITNDEYFPSLTGGAPIVSGQTGSFWGKPSMPKSPKENVPDLGEFQLFTLSVFFKIFISECGRPSTAQDIGSDIAQAIEAASNAAAKKVSDGPGSTKPKRGQKKKKGTKIAF